MCGHILDCFDRYLICRTAGTAMLRFAHTQIRQLCAKSVAKKAARFLQKHEL